MKLLYNILLFIFIAITNTSQSQIILFDFGGVFIGAKNTNWTQDFLINSLDMTLNEYKKIVKSNGIIKSHSSSGKKFWLSYVQSCGYELSDSWISEFDHAIKKDCLGVNSKMFNLVKTLQDGNIPCYLLSNLEKSLADFIKKEGLFDTFNECYLSCEIGIKKPDLNAYIYVLDRLGINASEVIFIDDIKSNIEAANSLGIDGILFESEEQLRRDLNTRGFLIKK